MPVDIAADPGYKIQDARLFTVISPDRTLHLVSCIMHRYFYFGEFSVFSASVIKSPV
jgi:hypothetical protein